jgi:hypothetical protein
MFAINVDEFKSEPRIRRGDVLLTPQYPRRDDVEAVVTALLQIAQKGQCDTSRAAAYVKYSMVGLKAACGNNFGEAFFPGGYIRACIVEAHAAGRDQRMAFSRNTFVNVNREIHAHPDGIAHGRIL